MIDHLESMHLDNYLKLPDDIKKEAINILRSRIPEDIIKQIKNEIIKNPNEWWVKHHFWWGMTIRNLLRDNGLSDNKLPKNNEQSGNWDDYYIPCIEMACKEGIYHKLSSEEKI